MKKLQISATSWMIGFPLVVFLIVPQFGFSSSEALLNLTREAIVTPKTCSFDKIQRLTNEVLARATHSSSEVMIDCSLNLNSNNKIMNNWFSGLNRGGIYLYRNCGETGVSRHSTPENNKIINNIFYYNKYKGSKPSIYLGSWDGKQRYCDKDSDSDYGSGVSDLDYARYNVVMQNQIYKLPVNKMIRTKNKTVNSPNYIGYNQTVTKKTVVTNRLAGCYVPQNYGYKGYFILHEQSIVAFKKNSKGQTISHGKKYTCNDGDLIMQPLQAVK